jgi:Sulfotransferase family
MSPNSPNPPVTDSSNLGTDTGPAGVTAQRAQRRVPDFFIVGHPKCGTTALYEMLRRQPRIYMPALKEPQFFAEEMRPGARPKHLPDTIDDYLALFDGARADQLAGEASPSYLRSPAAPAKIAALTPKARIVAILREPASFLRSVHLQFVQAMIEPEHDLRRALALEDERRQGRSIPRHSYWPRALLYSEHVRYVEQLRRYHAAFSPENVLVLIYDDFRADNEGTVRDLLRFLGVRDPAPVEALQANPTVTARSHAAHELVHTVAVGRGAASRSLNAALKALTPEGPRRRLLSTIRRRYIYGAPPAVDEQLVRELRRRLKPEVVALSAYLGRDLVDLWGYADVE